MKQTLFLERNGVSGKLARSGIEGGPEGRAKVVYSLLHLW